MYRKLSIQLLDLSYHYIIITKIEIPTFLVDKNPTIIMQ